MYGSIHPSIHRHDQFKNTFYLYSFTACWKRRSSTLTFTVLTGNTFFYITKAFFMTLSNFCLRFEVPASSWKRCSSIMDSGSSSNAGRFNRHLQSHLETGLKKFFLLFSKWRSLLLSFGTPYSYLLLSLCQQAQPCTKPNKILHTGQVFGQKWKIRKCRSKIIGQGKKITPRITDFL